jgi:tungstate transport system substrate-binding protein
MRLTLLLSLFVLGTAALALTACGDADEPVDRIRLVTTTSTRDSGLLDYLLKPWSKETNIEVQVVAVGTGQALALGTRGDADIVMVHARAREDAFVEAGHGVDRRDLMWNDFVIAGPPEDPAGIQGATDVVAALREIHASGAKFVSRGDDSGTHIREQSLWKAAGLAPREEPFYYQAGQGMGPCLTMADELRAYILTDRGTYLAVKSNKNLAVLVEGDTRLRNPYGVILVNPEKHPHVRVDAAKKLMDFLTSREGQAKIGAFRVDGEILFHPVSTQ